MKQNIKDRIFFIIIMCILVLPFAGMPFHMTQKDIGNSPLKAAPALTDRDGKPNIGFLHDAGDWFESVFAFRPEMVTADSLAQKWLFGVSSQDSVILGKKGWLFYSATENDYTRQEPASARMLFNIANNVRLLQDYIGSKGASAVFTVAPNKNSLYPEYMPSGYLVNDAGSTAERLSGMLEDVNYADLYGLFGSAEGEPLYYERDSHWTETGAVMVYRKLMEKGGYAEEDLAVLSGEPEVYRDYYGDLSGMLYPSELFPEDREVYIREPAWEYSGEASDVTASYIETVNKSTGNEDRVVMYRDSFGNSLLPYFAQTFGEGVFSQNMPYAVDADMGESTDLVIVEIVERHLASLGRVAPLHKALPADMDAAADTVRFEHLSDPGNNSGIRRSLNKGYTVFSGSLDQKFMAPDSRIYVLTEEEGGYRCYEAYTVRTDGSDFGFSVSFDEEQMEAMESAGQNIYAAVKDAAGGYDVLCFMSVRK